MNWKSWKLWAVVTAIVVLVVCVVLFLTVPAFKEFVLNAIVYVLTAGISFGVGYGTRVYIEKKQ